MPECRSCHATIIFATHPRTGRAMPINVNPDPVAGNILLDFDDGNHQVLGPDDAELARAEGAKLHLSHFVTCPNRDQHRKTG